MKRQHARDRVMASHDACTSGTSQVLTLVSLQRFKMEALIPVATDCEVWSVIKIFNAQSNSSSAVAGLWPYTARRSTHLLQELGWEVFKHYPPYSPNLAPSDFHNLLHFKKFPSCQHFQNGREAEMSVTVFPILGDKLLRHRIQKLVPLYDKCLDSRGEYVEK